MRSRKRLWIAVGALCALALGIGWLARPEDELAGVMRLHPRVKVDYEPNRPREIFLTEYDFWAPVAQVMAAVPGRKRPSGPIGVMDSNPMGATYEIAVPSGRRVSLWDYRELETSDRSTCILLVFGDRRPWYQRAWSRMKYRLGL
ncbi:MAG: hypothetical protein ACHQ50_01815 [Fimbriimonadales bacterium]